MKMTAMCKSIPLDRIGASVLCLFFLVFAASGCGKSERPKKSEEPVVIKKRISEQEPSAEKVRVKTPQAPPTKQPAGPPQGKKVSPTPGTPEAAASAHAQAPGTPAAKPSEAKGAPEVSLSEKLADVTPRYNPKGKIDPFAPLFSETPGLASSSGKKYVRRRPLTPLERIDLSQLRLVGIIWSKSGNLAMVEDATGKGYVIAKGTYIGVHGGKVVKITNDGAIVQESLENVFGKRTVKQKELKLQGPAGEE
jgi:type IV pilus assembly protein PilP